MFTISHAQRAQVLIDMDVTNVKHFYKSDSIFELRGDYGIISKEGEIIAPANYVEITPLSDTISRQYFLYRKWSAPKYGFMDSAYNQITMEVYERIRFLGSVPLHTGDVKDFFVLTKDGWDELYAVTDEYDRKETFVKCTNISLYNRAGVWYYKYFAVGTQQWTEEPAEDMPLPPPYDFKKQRQFKMFYTVLYRFLYLSPWVILIFLHRKQKKLVRKHVLVFLISTAIPVVVFLIANSMHVRKGFLDFTLLPLLLVLGISYLIWMLSYVIVQIRIHKQKDHEHGNR